MNKVEKLNQLVADLLYLNVKFHNLHWNVVGLQFEGIHNFTEQAYDDFFAKYDELAERLKTLGHYPPAALSTYAELTNVSELENKDYTSLEVLEHVRETYEYLHSEFTTLRSLADDEDDFVTVALAEDYLSQFEKHLWFVRSMQK